MSSLRASSVSALLAILIAALPSLAQAGPTGSPDAAAANRAAIVAHVNGVARRALGFRAPPIDLIEKQVVLARHADGGLEVSTGLLGLLTSDAQLAMLLAYEHLRGDTAGDATISRRKGRAAIKRDDAAVDAGLNCLLSAGFDGEQAIKAWTRLEPARSLGTPTPGALGDAKADHQRLAHVTKTLASTASTKPGHIGEDEYRAEVRARLDAWKILDRPIGDPTATTDPSTPTTPTPSTTPAPPTPAPIAWLTYSRSGGITGWSLVLSIEPSGHLHATESRRGSPPVDKQLSAEELTRLNGLVAQALMAPARQADSALGSLRDGQNRSLEIREGERTRRLTLSDGYDLFPFDGQLIQLLEGWAR